MKKKIIIIVISAVVLLGIGCAVYLLFFNTNVKNNNKITTVAMPDKISLNTIKALAKIDKNIDDTFVNEIDLNINYDYLPSPGSIKIKNNQLYFNYEINDYNYEIKIDNLKEKVILIKEVNFLSPAIPEYFPSIYILTESKNLYILNDNVVKTNKNDEAYVEDDIFNLLEKMGCGATYDGNKEKCKNWSTKELKEANEDIEEMVSGFGFAKANKKHDVLAFTNLYKDSRTSGGLPYVYTSDKKYRALDDFSYIYDGMTKEIYFWQASSDNCPLNNIELDGCSNGFLIYEDNNLSITGKKLIKNKNNELLKYKFIYIFGSNNKLKTDFIIVDENNDVYISTLDNYNKQIYDFKTLEDEVKLYSNSKYIYTEMYNIDQKQELMRGGYSLNKKNEDQIQKIILYLENNKKITIQMEEYDSFINLEPKLSEIHSIIYK